MKLKLIAALLIFQFSLAQQRTCATNLFMQQMMNNPVAKQKHEDLQNRFEIELSKLQNQQRTSAISASATIIVPIAVHFPDVAPTSTEKECLKQLAQNQIDILNNDFNATNLDITLWTPTVSALYPGTNVGIFNVQFVLATQNHPTGSGLAAGQLAVTFGTNFLSNADNDPQWSHYINIVVRVANALGYSPLGGSPNDGSTVVINYDAFGSGTGCTGYIPAGDYNLGRTLSHELGHFFNVDHTFGNSLCNAANTDYVDDTPQCLASSGCPPNGSVSGCVAGQKSLTMNYMDYTDDACMYMFTAGQANRMRAYYNTILSQLATNVLSKDSFSLINVALYPNPNTGSFTISFKTKTNDDIKISICDISGKNIYTKTFQNFGIFDQNLELNNVNSGIYFATILNGEMKIVKKILIE